MRNKLIAAGVGLFGYGVLLGWSFTADHLENKMKSNQRLLGDVINRQAAELSTMRNILLRKGDFYTETDASDVGTTVEGKVAYSDADVETFEDIRGVDREPTEEELEASRSRLQNIISEYTDDDDVISGFTKKAQRVIHDHGPPPYVISKEKYAWDEEGDDYSKNDVTWYEINRVMVDDEGDEIEDPDLLIGMVNLNRFGDESDDPNVVFVRNDPLMMDFEVFKNDEEEAPLHVRYGMGRQEFEARKAGGTIQFGRDT